METKPAAVDRHLCCYPLLDQGDEWRTIAEHLVAVVLGVLGRPDVVQHDDAAVLVIRIP